MKKLVFGLSFIVLTASIITACKKHESSPGETLEDLKLRVESNLDIPGTVHNKSLSIAFEDLNKIDISSYSESEILEVSKASIINNLYDFTSGVLSKEEITNFISSCENNSLEKNTTPQTNLIIQYSNEFKNVIDSLSTIEEYNTKINEIVNIASLEQDIETETLNTIIAIASVAKNSNEYWYNNSNDWYNLLNFEKKPKPGFEDRIIEADIEGAVQGGLTGLVGGWVGGAIGALLGSPVASAWQGITEYN
jgi:hypothetical protein